MLILSRKKGQKLIINDNIEIVIIEADSGIAKVGIKAPKNITIYREEIYKELQSANKTSTDSQVNVLNELEKEMGNISSLDKGLKSFSIKIKKNEQK